MRKAAHSLIFLSFVAISLLGGCSSGGEKEAEPVNILFLVTDDQRWDALYYTCNQVVLTSVLEEFRERKTAWREAVNAKTIVEAP